MNFFSVKWFCSQNNTHYATAETGLSVCVCVEASHCLAYTHHHHCRVLLLPACLLAAAATHGVLIETHVSLYVLSFSHSFASSDGVHQGVPFPHIDLFCIQYWMRCQSEMAFTTQPRKRAAVKKRRHKIIYKNIECACIELCVCARVCEIWYGVVVVLFIHICVWIQFRIQKLSTLSVFLLLHHFGVARVFSSLCMVNVERMRRSHARQQHRAQRIKQHEFIRQLPQNASNSLTLFGGSRIHNNKYIDVSVLFASSSDARRLWRAVFHSIYPYNLIQRPFWMYQRPAILLICKPRRNNIKHFV